MFKSIRNINPPNNIKCIKNRSNPTYHFPKKSVNKIALMI